MKKDNRNVLKQLVFLQKYMDRLHELLENLLCHEAISLFIYVTALLLLLFYIPYWIRQHLDRTYLKFVGKKARESHLKPRMESPERSPDVDHMDSGLMKEDADAAGGHGDGDGDAEQTVRKADNPDLGTVVQKDSDERLSHVSPVTSRVGHYQQTEANNQKEK